MRIMNRGDERAISAVEIDLENIEELEEILAPTPSIPIPPPLR